MVSVSPLAHLGFLNSLSRCKSEGEEGGVRLISCHQSIMKKWKETPYNITGYFIRH